MVAGAAPPLGAIDPNDRVGTIIADSCAVGYPISAETHRILEDLGHLRTAARALLDEASPGARDEWKRFEERFPSDVEIRRGFIALSKPELEEMWSKVRRFRDILAAGRRRGPKLSRGGTDRAHSDGGGGGDASPAVPSTDVQLDIGVARQK